MPQQAPQHGDMTGSFRASQIRDGENVELSEGHVIRCMTAGGRHARAHTAGAVALTTAALSARKTGVDAGVAWNEGKNLRAPDIVVGVELPDSGWAEGAPPLAVEYAAQGQDERQLAEKIAELLAFGTKFVWVVRLVGPLRVEVHEPGTKVRLVDADGLLEAPGVLHQPVPVRALVDPELAVEVALHNILARKGYRDLAEVRKEGHKEGRKEGLKKGREEGLKVLREAIRARISTRGWALTPAHAARISACSDFLILTRWVAQLETATDLTAALR